MTLNDFHKITITFTPKSNLIVLPNWMKKRSHTPKKKIFNKLKCHLAMLSPTLCRNWSTLYDCFHKVVKIMVSYPPFIFIIILHPSSDHECQHKNTKRNDSPGNDDFFLLGILYSLFLPFSFMVKKYIIKS